MLLRSRILPSDLDGYLLAYRSMNQAYKHSSLKSEDKAELWSDNAVHWNHCYSSYTCFTAHCDVVCRFICQGLIAALYQRLSSVMTMEDVMGVVMGML